MAWNLVEAVLAPVLSQLVCLSTAGAQLYGYTNLAPCTKRYRKAFYKAARCTDTDIRQEETKAEILCLLRLELITIHDIMSEYVVITCLLAGLSRVMQFKVSCAL